MINIKNSSKSVISFPTLGIQLKPNETTTLHPSNINIVKSYIPLGIEIIPDELEEEVQQRDEKEETLPLNDEPIEPKKKRRGRPRKTAK